MSGHNRAGRIMAGHYRSAPNKSAPFKKAEGPALHHTSPFVIETMQINLPPINRPTCAYPVLPKAFGHFARF